MLRKLTMAAAAVFTLSSVQSFAQTDPAHTSDQSAAPPTPAPDTIPSLTEPPPPPPTASQSAPATAAPGGQWVYTQQYGWVWMPYGQNYTYVDPNADLAQMYVYRAGIGWAWLASPWVFGYGPTPYWGLYGYGGFAWYAHPWFHTRYGYGWGWGRYGGHPFYGRGWGGGWHGVGNYSGAWRGGYGGHGVVRYGGHAGGFAGGHFGGGFGGGHFGGFGGGHFGGGGHHR